MTYMIEDFYFLAKNQINLTASSIGISKSKWTSIDEREIERDEYKGKMRSLRFDHLPIISENNNVYEYFKTLQSNNYDNIVRYKISIDDVISINTDIRDVINKFSSLNRTFYFLALHNQILGLITIGNINSKQVQVYIFSLICDLERALGDFINRNLSSEKIETYIFSKIDPEDVMDKYRLMLENYRQLVLLDLDNKLTEHFFFIDFFNLITDFKLYEKLGFSRTKWEEQSSINEIRKRVAHPSRSIIDTDNNINKLAKRLDKIDDILFRLYQLNDF